MKRGFTLVKQKQSLTGLVPVRQKRYLTGFTIVELIIVIAIIAVLATITTVSYARSKMRARDTVRISDLNSVAQAVLVYKEAKGTYPPNLCTNNPKGVSYFNGYCGSGTTRDESKVSLNVLAPDYISFLPHDVKIIESKYDSDYWYYDYSLTPGSITAPIVTAELEINSTKGWAPIMSDIPATNKAFIDCARKSTTTTTTYGGSTTATNDPVRYCVRVAP